MCVRGANIRALVAAKLLEANPNVGLQVLNQMPHMNWPVGIGQGAGDENFSFLLRHSGGVSRSYWARLCHAKRKLISVFNLLESVLVLRQLVSHLAGCTAFINELHQRIVHGLHLNASAALYGRFELVMFALPDQVGNGRRIDHNYEGRGASWTMDGG